MLFNSLTFALFLPIVFAGYWLLQKSSLRLQNAFVLFASYVFYGWWDWRFLFLILFSSTVDYSVSRALGRTSLSGKRKALLAVSLACDLGVLCFFKYFNFFIDSFSALFVSMGMRLDMPTLHIILPVGISFYTFQSLSYTLDVYRRQVEPVDDFVAFLAFVSFFPQLVAGPIERAGNLLPQFLVRRRFDTDKASDGLRQALWGLFKKVVIADNLAESVDTIFSDPVAHAGSELVLGAAYFATQIYCDFSGYSDIAIGVARLFGFELRRNFAYPYFSRDIVEFWRRWHISLSTWFRDYVFIPLGGSHGVSKSRWLANVLATFTISGLWHGADWKFIFWGFLNGVLYIVWPKRTVTPNSETPSGERRLLVSMHNACQICATFGAILLGWVFFRAPSLSIAFQYLSSVFKGSWHSLPKTAHLLVFLALLFPIEWLQRDKMHPLAISALPRWVRWAVYYVVCSFILLTGNLHHVPFIYFQF